MKKLGCLVSLFCLTLIKTGVAQDLFWNFDDNQNPLTIPAECDAKFDEIRGGVFMPTIDEMYEYGMAFLGNPALSVQQQGAYCLLGAALQGHPQAQLEMAKMYAQGKILPQDDLSAYKWAFIAALNGNKAAEKVTLSLEQFLTTSDLEKTSAAIQETRMQIQQNLQQQLEEEKRQNMEGKEKLKQINSEMLEQKNEDSKASDEIKTGPAPEDLQKINSNLVNIFDESDRLK